MEIVNSIGTYTQYSSTLSLYSGQIQKLTYLIQQVNDRERTSILLVIVCSIYLALSTVFETKTETILYTSCISPLWQYQIQIAILSLKIKKLIFFYHFD